jgi:hypothetical protein
MTIALAADWLARANERTPPGAEDAAADVWMAARNGGDVAAAWAAWDSTTSGAGAAGAPEKRYVRRVRTALQAECLPLPAAMRKMNVR